MSAFRGQLRHVVTGTSGEAPERLEQLGPERVVVAIVGRREDTHHEIEGRGGHGRIEQLEHVESYDFAQPSFHAVPLDARVLVLGHDEPHAWKRMKGSGGAHV